MEKRKNSRMSENRIATKCETCVYSVSCTLLKPCRDYAPATHSNFNALVEIDRSYQNRELMV